MASKSSIFRWFLPSRAEPHPAASASAPAPPPYPMTDPDHAPADPHPKAEDPLLQGLRCLDLKPDDEAEAEADGDKVEVEGGKGGGGGKEKAKDEGEDSVEVERGEGSVRYPVRPEAEDCSYYMRTGNCKFGSDCKFNHPVVRKNQVFPFSFLLELCPKSVPYIFPSSFFDVWFSKDKVKEKEESRDRAFRTECKVNCFNVQ